MRKPQPFQVCAPAPPVFPDARLRGKRSLVLRIFWRAERTPRAFARSFFLPEARGVVLRVGDLSAVYRGLRGRSGDPTIGSYEISWNGANCFSLVYGPGAQSRANGLGPVTFSAELPGLREKALCGTDSGELFSGQRHLGWPACERLLSTGTEAPRATDVAARVELKKRIDPLIGELRSAVKAQEPREPLPAKTR